MTAHPTAAELGRAVLAVDSMLRDPRWAEFGAVLRAAMPVGLVDQLDAAAADNHRHLTVEAAVLNGWVSYRTAEESPEWMTLGALQALAEWHSPRARTCTHRLDPRRPGPVIAAAWKPALIVCPDCEHLLCVPRGSDADRTCDSCGHLCAGLEHDDGITPVRLGLGPLTYQAGVCMTCRWWT